MSSPSAYRPRHISYISPPEFDDPNWIVVIGLPSQPTPFVLPHAAIPRRAAIYSAHRFRSEGAAWRWYERVSVSRTVMMTDEQVAREHVW